MLPRKHLCCLAVLLLAGLAFRPAAIAEDLIPDGMQPNIESRAAIRQALTKKINWDMTEKPLGEVVEELKKELNIPMRLDMRTLNDIGVTPDTPITFKMSGITAKSALSLLLRDLALTTMIRDEVLLVTTPDEAENQLETVVYNVADLVQAASGTPVSNLNLPGGYTTVPVQLGGAPAAPRKSTPLAHQSDFDSLIDVITKSIKPTAWDDVGGPGSIQPFESAGICAIVVTHTDEVHEEIAKLLAQLRALRHPAAAPSKSPPAVVN
jgi:hypothetical protein